MQIRNVTRGVVLGHAIDIADTSAARRRGLLGRSGLMSGEGLWIVPCESIHTWGMQFRIDVAFLNRRRKVVKVRKEMDRRRVTFCLWAHSVLELPAGVLGESGTRKGDQLEFLR